MIYIKIYLTLSLYLSAIYLSGSSKVVGCYWGSWSVWRNSFGKFTTEDIDPSLCTHVYYSFARINSATLEVEVLDWQVDINLGGYKNFTSLKNDYPDTKFLIAIGGWSQGSYAFSQIAGSQTLRTQFVNQILELIQTYQFDGLDVDWEYPASRDTFYGAQDKDNFILLLKELRTAFEPQGLALTVAVGSLPYYIDSAYDVTALSEVVDLINFMTYDMRGSWDGITGVNSPLYDPTSTINVDSFVTAWITAGVDPEKLVIGIPSYGKSFTLGNSLNTEIGAPIWGVGNAGPYLQEAGNLAYYEILQNIENGWTVMYDETIQSPYAFLDNQWVGYDDERSVSAKVNYTCSKNLGGVMTWAIDLDDFSGRFGENFPLLRAMNSVLHC